MIRKLLLAVLSVFLLCACGGTAGEETAAKAEPLNLVGDWKEETDNTGYMYAIIAGNTIEIYMESEDSRSLYWAGSFEEPAEPGNTYSWVSENDYTKTSHALLASGAETKEFTYEDGYLSFSSTIMGIESTRKLKKVSDTPSTEEMQSTITVAQSELKQPELMDLGGSFPENSNYYHYAALIKNPNENMCIRFANYKVVVKDSAGTILAADDGTIGDIYPGGVFVVDDFVDCSGGAVDTIDFSVSCNNDDFVQNLSTVDSRNFYFNSLNYIVKGSSFYQNSITGILFNNTNVKCESVRISALYRKEGKIVYCESQYVDNIVPGENIFQFDIMGGFGDYDTIELFAQDWFSSSNEKVSDFTPEEGLKNENTIYITADGFTTVKPSTETAPEEEAAAEETAASEVSDDDFKTKMDTLEAFFDSYAEFMKSYDSSNTEMLGKYTEMMGQYTEAMNALNEIGESSLTQEQKEYYTEVMLRINQKLLEASAAMQG